MRFDELRKNEELFKITPPDSLYILVFSLVFKSLEDTHMRYHLLLHKHQVEYGISEIAAGTESASL
jgi:hypothetical protein